MEKTHQTLHKHIKAFEQVLSRPVTQTLTDVQNDWSSQKDSNEEGDINKAETLTYQVEKYIAEERLKVNMIMSTVLYCVIRNRHTGMVDRFLFDHYYIGI